MYPNMKAEMARGGVTGVSIAKALDISRHTFTNKLHGHSAFSIDECKTIKSTFFPECTLEYLFDDTTNPHNNTA